MFKNYYFILLCLFSVLSYGQERQVKGTVSDKAGDPLPGAAVQVKGTGTGTITDVNGSFSIQATNSDVLVVSFVGYETAEVEVGSQTSISITLQEAGKLEEVLIVGTRNPNRTATETVVPVDIIEVSDLLEQGAQVNINQILNYVAPSFSSNTQTVSDGTDHVDPASLRGLGPDQVLVLINGKRRHTSSLVNVNGTVGRGNVGTDLNAIPAAAIERIEVLRDGASAQYGSDALAGIINIVLKQDVNKLNLALSTGGNLSSNGNNFDGGSDGETVQLDANYGMPLGTKGGYVNFTGSMRTRAATSRTRAYSGQIFNGYNAVEWVASQDGADLSNLSMADIQAYAQNVTHFDATLKGDIQNATSMADLQNLLGGDVTDAELAARGLDRSDFSMRVGQSKLRSGKLFVNMALPAGENSEFYAFGGLSYRNGEAAGFYRRPAQSRTNTAIYLNGFLPEIHSDVRDQSLAFGIRGQYPNGWNVDISNTFGRNSFEFGVENTSNATLGNATPLSFEAGGFAFTQNTTNLDVSRFYDKIWSGINVAFGAEYRIENYSIFAGNENSWGTYDINGDLVTATTPDSLRVKDFFGNNRPGGSQVFPGYRPQNELSKFRNSAAAYFDIEADITDFWTVGLATRFEDYSDFGTTFNYKLATRLELLDNLAIRGAFSTGFRAPSLHQIYFNATSTQFVNGVPFEVGTFSNNSRIARLLGIPQLKEETSQNISFGLTTKLFDGSVSVTVDAFQIDIDDRVVLTDQFSQPAQADNPELWQLFEQANATAATFFVNAINTRTQGVDVVISHRMRLGKNYTFTNDLAGMFSTTERVGDINFPEALTEQAERFYSTRSAIFLESASPRTKVNLTNTLNGNRWSFMLRNAYFGEVTEADQGTDAANNPYNQVFPGQVITDVSVTYRFMKSLALTVGANNVLDIYPDEKEYGTSGDQFVFSRRISQFGFNGRYVFTRLLLTL